jgi:hypothetical protein
MRKLVIADADVMRMAIQQEIARSDESEVVNESVEIS